MGRGSDGGRGAAHASTSERTLTPVSYRAIVAAEVEPIREHALHLADDLLDEVPRLLRPGTDHRDAEAQRPGAPGGHGDEREQQHVGQLDDAGRRAAQREHLEDGRPVAHEPVRAAQLVARDRQRRLDPVGERRLLVERLQHAARG